VSASFPFFFRCGLPLFWFLQDAAASLVAQRAPTSSSQRVTIENQVFNELMYSDEDERLQQPVGYWVGVNKRKMFGVEGELRRGFCPSGISAGLQVSSKVSFL